MIAAIRQQTELRRLLEFTANEDIGRVRRWLAEHLAVLRALRADDRARAALLLGAHLRHAAAFAQGTLTGLNEATP
jgi:DNA-binding GntR family transcriptional regulator